MVNPKQSPGLYLCSSVKFVVRKKRARALRSLSYLLLNSDPKHLCPSVPSVVKNPSPRYSAFPRLRAPRASVVKKPLPFLLFPLLTLALSLTGCVTPATPTAQVTPADPLSYPPAEPIGHITFVDPAENLALVRMRTSSTRAAPIMTARNDALVPTALLEPTRFQRGRTLGTRILEGLPNVGDEVLPGNLQTPPPAPEPPAPQITPPPENP